MTTRRTWPSERAALVLLAFAARLVVVWISEPEPVWDGRYFDAFARHLARGDGYVVAVEGAGETLRPTAHYPVGYPALLALAYRIFGDRVGVALVLQCALGAVLVGLVHALAARVTDARGARVAGLVTALHPGLVLQGTLVMAEPLAALLYAALVACALAIPESLAAAALGGLVGGIATLVRPQSILVVPLLVACALVTARASSRRAVASTAVVAIAFAAVVAPWSLRNARALDGFAMVSTNGGWNLAIGALPGATGRYRALPSGHGCEGVGGEVAVDRCLAAKAREAIARDPLAFVRLLPAKVSFAIDYEAFPVEALHEAHPERVPDGLRRAGWRCLMAAHQALLLAAAFATLRGRSHRMHAVAFALALAPMIALGRPTSAGIALALACALLKDAALTLRLVGMTLFVFQGTHAVFFGEDRYHMVIEALLVLPLVARARDASPRAGSVSTK